MQEKGGKKLLKFTFLTQMVGLPVGTLLTFIFGTWTPLMGVLLVMVTIDILTGIAKGIYDKSLRSRTMSQGMIRKVMIFLVVVLANMLDIAVFGGIPVAKTGAISFYIGMEGLSVLENLGQMNIPLPKFIKEYLLILKNKGNENKNDNNEKL